MKLTLDFEVRSPVDLKKCGAYVYAEHPETEPLCLAVKLDEFPAGLWVNDRFRHVYPDALFAWSISTLVGMADIVEAHNAQFERAIWRYIMVPRFGWPDIPDHKWRCSAAKAAAHALPRSLEGAGAALGLKVQKDKRGAFLVQKLCKPRKPRKGEPAGLYWNEDPEDLLGLFQYCIQDVETEHELSSKLPDLNPTEQRVWALDAVMNARGILADVETAKKIIKIVKGYEEKLLEEVQEITNGDIQSVKQVEKMVEACGVDNLQAATVTEALENGNLTPTARRLLEIRQILGQSSVSKYSKILVRACTDGRLRGELFYHGASPGRWTGRGVQLQNLPRACIESEYIELALQLVQDGDTDWIDNLFGNTLDFAKGLIRPTFIAAPGKELVTADFSQIEARGTLWYAEEEEGLNLFRAKQDIYCDMASDIYEKTVTKADKIERFIGKTAILGLGYGMGAPKFRLTCQGGGVEVTKKFARKVVKTYRSRFANVPQFWYSTERAAVSAVQSGEPVQNGRNTWFMDGRFLRCKLPSGRTLAYADPRIDVVPAWIYPCVDEDGKETSIMVIAKDRKIAAVMSKKRAADEELRIIGEPIEREKQVLSHMAVVKGKLWQRETTYGGKLVENIVQGTARDIMAEGMLRLEARGYPVILSVHDEVISEVPEGFGSVEEFEKIMCVLPSWAAGLPVAAEGWRGKRYRK